MTGESLQGKGRREGVSAPCGGAEGLSGLDSSSRSVLVFRSVQRSSFGQELATKTCELGLASPFLKELSVNPSPQTSLHQRLLEAGEILSGWPFAREVSIKPAPFLKIPVCLSTDILPPPFLTGATSISHIRNLSYLRLLSPPCRCSHLEAESCSKGSQGQSCVSSLPPPQSVSGAY